MCEEGGAPFIIHGSDKHHGHDEDELGAHELAVVMLCSRQRASAHASQPTRRCSPTSRPGESLFHKQAGGNPVPPAAGENPVSSASRGKAASTCHGLQPPRAPEGSPAIEKLSSRMRTRTPHTLASWCMLPWWGQLLHFAVSENTYQSNIFQTMVKFLASHRRMTFWLE